jgi:hypothetical protein
MALEDSVNTLVTQTTALLNTVNVAKATLDASVEDAGDFAQASLTSANNSAASASTATTQATAAQTARTGAEAARDAAIVAQNNAVEVVTGGTATLTPEAGKIPLADAEAKIDAGWLTDNALVEQSDIGTAPNEIPLNQYLGSLAYQDLNSVVIEGGTLAGLDIQSLADQVSADAVNTGIVNAEQFLAGSSAVLRGGSTNLVKYSEDYSNASWAKVSATVTANTNIAPDGTLTADTINFSANDGQIRQDNVGTAGVAHTLSVWLAGSGTIYLSSYDNVSSAQSKLVTLTSTLTRYTFTFTFGAGSTDRRVYPANRLNNATTTTSVVVWGAQLNLGSTPQPYLKTVATAVTTAYAAPLESPNGLALPLLASMTPARNADMTFELASDTSLVVKVKGSDGTVRSATLTLA